MAVSNITPTRFYVINLISGFYSLNTVCQCVITLCKYAVPSWTLFPYSKSYILHQMITGPCSAAAGLFTPIDNGTNLWNKQAYFFHRAGWHAERVRLREKGGAKNTTCRVGVQINPLVLVTLQPLLHPPTPRFLYKHVGLFINIVCVAIVLSCCSTVAAADVSLVAPQEIEIISELCGIRVLSPR